MTLKEIRLAAADLLESRPDAWGQGAFRRRLPSGDYAYCIIGACREIAGYHTTRCVPLDIRVVAYCAALDAVRDVGATCATASEWNDAQGRTREEVIAALRAVT